MERDQYQFRVKAVNKAGPGAASDPTEYHTVKHRKREYKPGVPPPPIPPSTTLSNTGNVSTSQPYDFMEVPVLS